MDKYSLKITSAVAIGGQIHRKDSIVPDVPEQLAKDLLRRGKAELATEDNVPAAVVTSQVGALTTEGVQALATEQVAALVTDQVQALKPAGKGKGKK